MVVTTTEKEPLHCYISYANEHDDWKHGSEIHNQNAYPLITAHLISLANVQRMGIWIFRDDLNM